MGEKRTCLCLFHSLFGNSLSSATHRWKMPPNPKTRPSLGHMITSCPFTLAPHIPLTCNPPTNNKNNNTRASPLAPSQPETKKRIHPSRVDKLSTPGLLRTTLSHQLVCIKFYNLTRCVGPTLLLSPPTSPMRRPCAAPGGRGTPGPCRTA